MPSSAAVTMNPNLPADVRTSLAAGDKIEAIRRLRVHHPDMSLAESKAAIDSAGMSSADAPIDRGWELPADVQSALDKGSVLQALRALRSKGVGLKQAKSMVDTAQRASERAGARGPIDQHRTGLAPGEVPRSPIGTGTLIIVLMVLAYLVWQFLKTDWI